MLLSKPSPNSFLERITKCIGFCQQVLFRHASRYGKAILLFQVILFSGAGAVQAELTVNREYAIKAAFLYNFSLYTKWPENVFSSPEEPFVIGVFKEDPFGAILDKIAKSKKVEGRTIVIQRLESLDKVAGCHILYLPRTIGPEDNVAIRKKIDNLHVLCVGEVEEYADQGGTVQFYVEGNRVRFTINTATLERRKLKISSKLLSLAKIVGDKG